MRKLPIMAVLLMITACGPNYPLGMSEAEWTSLPIEKRQALLEEQQRQEALALAQQQEALRVQHEQQLQNERFRLEAGARERLGITPYEWSRLTPDKQFELRQEQESIERQQQDAQRAMQADRERHEQHHDERHDWHYGPVVACDISGGSAKYQQGFHSQWAPFLPVHFELTPDTAAKVTLQRADKGYTQEIWVRLRDERTAVVCRQEPVGAFSGCYAISVGQPASVTLDATLAAATVDCRRR